MQEDPCLPLLSDQFYLPKCIPVFDQLSSLAKNFSLAVVKEGGVVRAIHNHGIRDLPHRFKARYADQQGVRYYRKGRFISIYYDSNPYAMRLAENTLALDPEVLRFTNLKARSPLNYVNETREDRNPYIKKVLQMEAAEKRMSSKSMDETNKAP